MPRFSVPYSAGYAFSWLLERLPGNSPFLTRSLVHVAEDWWCRTDHAADKLGYRAGKDWRTAVREALADLATHQPRRLPLTQEV
jgi:hypothetical protein